MPTNTAAWLTTAQAHPLDLQPAPLGIPSTHQILVKTHAVAINPIDTKLQSHAIYPLTYPTILGEDLAGTVIAVGPDVTRFQPGDRVLGCSAGFATQRNEEKAFQTYSILQSNLACPIPASISFESAVVLPLGVATAAAGLFNPDLLNLQLPAQPAPPPTGKTLLVWGGASSVGCNAIQLAVAAGYEVIATASPKNFAAVKSLGAAQVFDYHSATVVAELVAAFEGKASAGVYDAIGGEAAWVPVLEFVQRTEGGKMVATVTRGFASPPGGVVMRQVLSLSIRENFVGRAVFEEFLPRALEMGAYVPAPEPLVVGRGLECVQAGMDLLGRGVSNQKVVVVL
ncbi:hypothetical protein BP6252_13788 [Coleophoma cylindrospora]|uniref:Enoyl reductase (ER) domain-containing protein n=1 Tax=Coleophoma cylindrospora TaxID=1849047 RepID=A0A3D8Q710_9HELO|nr:hypothetical protein BP6252_13788 [Coleophoma cylindrospora]